MQPLSIIAIYFVVWWIALFAVLPWGTRPVAEPDSLTGWRGAPANLAMRKKIIATSIVAAVITAAIYAAFYFDMLGLEAMDGP